MSVRLFIPMILLLTAGPAFGQVGGAGGKSPLRILGFGDFGFQATDGADVTSTSGFREGQFALHFSSALSPRVGFFAETSLSARDDGFATALERIIVRFAYSDPLKLSVGRYHTPVNWWNMTFHHGQWLQTSVDRPLMARFGGAFVPVHLVGALEEGTAALGGLNPSWIAGLGNGRQSTLSAAGDAGDDDNHRALVGHLSIRPDAIYELELGGSFYKDAIPIDGGDSVPEQLFAAHAVWHSETPEVIAEFSRITHEDPATGTRFHNDAWYAQVAWRLSVLDGRAKPYVRFEDLAIDEGDPVYGSAVTAKAMAPLGKHDGGPSVLEDEELLTVGLRIDISEFVALKTEFRSRHHAQDARYQQYVMQIAFGF